MNFYKNKTFVIDDNAWADYISTKDIGLRNQILESYLYIVSTNIKKMNIFVTNREDIEDMTNQGILELINCIERYDYTRGIQFDTFASIRVRGSIIDYIRKKDWVPRDIRKRIRDLYDCEIQLQNEYGRQPSNNELAQQLNISEAEINKIRMDELSLNVFAFEELIQDNDTSFLDIESSTASSKPEDKVLNDEFKKVISKCINELDENERTVISLYYYEELKLKEIAFVMELTPSRISQIHSKALGKLKNRITEYMVG